MRQWCSWWLAVRRDTNAGGTGFHFTPCATNILPQSLIDMLLSWPHLTNLLRRDPGWIFSGPAMTTHIPLCIDWNDPLNLGFGVANQYSNGCHKLYGNCMFSVTNDILMYHYDTMKQLRQHRARNDLADYTPIGCLPLPFVIFLSL
jgi:hypothetical protein